MKEIVELKITHYRFSIGGEHYYGTLHVRTKEQIEIRDGEECRITRMGFGSIVHPHDRTEVKRKISQKEATYLNKKDGADGWGLKRGDLTNRFNDRESIIVAAKIVFAELFDETDLLVMVDDDYNKTAIAGPEDMVAFLTGSQSRRSEFEFLDARGYLLRDVGPS